MKEPFAKRDSAQRVSCDFITNRDEDPRICDVSPYHTGYHMDDLERLVHRHGALLCDARLQLNDTSTLTERGKRCAQVAFRLSQRGEALGFQFDRTQVREQRGGPTHFNVIVHLGEAPF